MNTSVADPRWDGWILWYFFLGGIAAGAYFLATLAEMFGREADRRALRAGYLIAAPLIAVCGLLLIADLSQPMRFWHMLLERDAWRPHLKFWSPMSIGAWAVLGFSLVSTCSFVGQLAESRCWGFGRFAPLAIRLHRGFWGRAFDLIGVTCGFFVASYTGVLLTATNQPVWSDSTWIGAMFLASSAGTGLAAIRLLRSLFGSRLVGADVPTDAAQRTLDRIERGAWALELAVATLFLASLDLTTLRALQTNGLALPFLGGAVGLGILLPGSLHWFPVGWRQRVTLVAAVSVLLGGFCLRYAILVAPRAVTTRRPVVHLDQYLHDRFQAEVADGEE